MQLCKVMVRLNGSLLHTVQKVDVTPAEILVLRAIHGQDAVTDIIPTKFDEGRRHNVEFDRLAHDYDRGAGTFASQPGEEDKGVMLRLFPGAVKRLPVTLEDIGINLGGEPVGAEAAETAADEIEQVPAEAAPEKVK